MQTEQQIRNELRRIVGNNNEGESFPVMSGTVVSFDELTMTAEVQLTCRYDQNDPSTTPGVLLNVMTGNVGGIYALPVAGSNCEVAELDGPGKWSIVRADSYTKVVVTVGSSMLTITDGLIQFNDGSLGGLVKVTDLTTKLNNLENLVNDLVSKFNSHTHILTLTSGTGTAAITVAPETTVLTPTEQSDIENTNVK